METLKHQLFFVHSSQDNESNRIAQKLTRLGCKVSTSGGGVPILWIDDACYIGSTDIEVALAEVLGEKHET